MTRRLLRGADAILRGGMLPAGRGGQPAWAQAAACLVVFGGCYGAFMGTFGGVTGERLLQVLFSAVKVPLLLVVTFAICLPSFFVLNTLLGVRPDFPAVLNALMLTQAGLTVLLAAFGPLTLFWYASSADYDAAVLFNALVFGAASLTAQWLLRRHYQPLIARNPNHRALLRVWLGLYAFVGIQTAWVLRPFVGSPGEPVQFFRQEAWGNAYVEVAQKVRAVTGR